MSAGAARTAGETLYLDSLLAPLAQLMARPDVTDIYVNAPRQAWVETLGGACEAVALPDLTEPVLLRLARQIAAASAQGISREHPLLAASLPATSLSDGARVQVVLPPATRGDVAIAIRKHVAGGLTLADYAAGGAFDRAGFGPARARETIAPPEVPSDYAAMLADAVRGRRNILVSGGTSSGKTTFLNALIAEVPQTERLILIEDTPELRVTQPNHVGLLAARGGMGEARVTPEDLLIAALRMRPDRIILGEMRGGEALTFLRAVNTGHPGSLSTIHADSPERAIDQLALLVLQTGAAMGWDDVVRYVRRSLDLVVHLVRDGEGRRIDRLMTVAE